MKFMAFDELNPTGREPRPARLGFEAASGEHGRVPRVARWSTKGEGGAG